MSEKISSNEQMMEPIGAVELGCASKQTRGAPNLLGLLDGGMLWPLIFWNG